MKKILLMLDSTKARFLSRPVAADCAVVRELGGIFCLSWGVFRVGKRRR